MSKQLITTKEFLNKPEMKVYRKKYPYVSFEKFVYKGCEIKSIVIDKRYNTKHLISPYSISFQNTLPCINNAINKTEYFIKKCELLEHGNKYGYSKVDYINDRTLIKIFCKDCKKYFEITPNHFLTGKGCRECGIKRRNEKLIIWTKEKIEEAISTCRTKKEFREKFNGRPFSAAFKNGWLDELYKKYPMIPLGNRENLGIYVFEFPNRSAYVGLTYNFDVRYKQHMEDKTGTVNKFINESCEIPEFVSLSGYDYTKTEAQKMEEYYLNKYKKEGWKILNRIKTGGLGAAAASKWSTKEVVLIEAKKHKTRSRFIKISSGAYGVAKKNGWLEECYEHMGPKINSNYKNINKNEFIKDFNKKLTYKELGRKYKIDVNTVISKIKEFNLCLRGKSFWFKSVIQKTLDGKIIKKFKSIAEARRITKTCSIGNVLSGRVETAGGFKWVYGNV